VLSLVERAGASASIVLPRLAEFVADVLDWNRSVSNLVSRNDESRLVSRHLVESLEPAAWLAGSNARRWIDLGSGAGFPALPIAIAGVGEKWLLVESRRPKTLFLRRVTHKLGLTNVGVAHSRLEDLLSRESMGDHDPEVEKAGGFPFDGFTSRATLILGPTLELAAASVRPGGHAFLWKGSGRETEKGSAAGWSRLWRSEGEMILEAGLTAVCNFLRSS
jgi:16S rRNA (guanine527-N7)-methyltransferase